MICESLEERIVSMYRTAVVVGEISEGAISKKEMLANKRHELFPDYIAAGQFNAFCASRDLVKNDVEIFDEKKGAC